MEGINRIMPVNASSYPAPSAAAIAAAVAAPSAATIATAVAAAVPTTAGITTIVQANAGSPYAGTITNLGFVTAHGASTATFTGLSSYKYLRLYFHGLQMTSNNIDFTFRLNGDSSNIYTWSGLRLRDGGTTNIMYQGSTQPYHYIGGVGNSTSSTNGMIEFLNSNSSAHKQYKYEFCWYDAGNPSIEYAKGNGMYLSTSAISSLTIGISSGTFNHSGTTRGFYLMGAN
jgi:hypothetical protein